MTQPTPQCSDPFATPPVTGPGFAFSASQRYPDPRVEVQDERFLKLRLYSTTVERLATGMRWAEGPVWFGDGRYLLVSDIPNNRILRWDECSGAVSTFRAPSGFANGHTRDLQGRLVSCEHGTRRVTRTEYDGRVTVLADGYQGKRLNSPNDVVCQKSNGALWFTDPPFGIGGHWEGEPAPAELPHAVYRIDAHTGALTQVLTELAGPNGLAFSPDESLLYVVESRATPSRRIWAYAVHADGTLGARQLAVDAQGAGALDGMAVDVQGNLWCGWGHDGRLAGAAGSPPNLAAAISEVPSERLPNTSPPAGEHDMNAPDGVRVFAPDGTAIAHIHLPERCANVCFGGLHRNRLFMAASHSLYALYVNTQGCA